MTTQRILFYCSSLDAALQVHREYVWAEKKEHISPLLSQKNRFPVSVTVSWRMLFYPRWWAERWRACNHSSVLAPRDLALFLKTMHTLLRDGMPVHEALLLVGHQRVSANMQDAVRRISAHVQQGLPMGKAFEKESKLWPKSMVVAMTVGQHSGQLESIFKHLAGVFERQVEVARDIQRVLFLPFITALAALGVLGWASQFFLSGSQPQPLFFRICAQASAFLVSYVLETAMGCALCVVLLGRVGVPVRFAYWRDAGVLRLPFVGVLVALSYSTFFFMLLSVLLQAGVPLLQALDSMVQLFPSRYWQQVITQLSHTISCGASWREALQSLPPTCAPSFFTQSLVTVSDQKRLAVVCAHTAELVAQERARRLEWYVSLLQPIVMIGIGSVIAYFLYAVHESFSLSTNSMIF